MGSERYGVKIWGYAKENSCMVFMMDDASPSCLVAKFIRLT